jgi:hypothetical protein
MRAFIPAVALLLIASAYTVPHAQSQTPRSPPSFANSGFRPAEVVSVEEIYHPFLSVARGPVIVEASVRANGTVEDVVVTHPIASLSEPSVHSIRNWKFKPATLDGKPVASRVTIAVLFNSYGRSPFTLPSPAPDHDLPQLDTAFDPPEVISVEGAPEPNALQGDGTVVLQAKISSSGDLNYASVVRDSPAFTVISLKALQKWQFRAAKFRGAPVTSTMPIAFVFHIIPASNTN